MTLRAVSPKVLPGFRRSAAITTTVLVLLLIVPALAAIIKLGSLSLEQFWGAISSPRAVAAYQLSLSSAFFAALINLLLGVNLAWVLVRYEFPTKSWWDALVDLPLALPTAVAGLVYSALYVPNGWLGQFLSPLGIQIAYSRLGIVLVLIFVGLPFVVRTVQPVLESMEREVEEAAASLGATRWQTFQRVLLPTLLPAALAGFSLAFARGLGEYGSVVFISNNIPGKTEIAPLLIVSQLESFHYAEATAIAVVLLGLSLLSLFMVNLMERWSQHAVAGG